MKILFQNTGTSYLFKSHQNRCSRGTIAQASRAIHHGEHFDAVTMPHGCILATVMAYGTEFAVIGYVAAVNHLQYRAGDAHLGKRSNTVASPLT